MIDGIQTKKGSQEDEKINGHSSAQRRHLNSLDRPVPHPPHLTVSGARWEQLPTVSVCKAGSSVQLRNALSVTRAYGFL